MPIQNTPAQYGGLAIALHWAAAAIILAMLATAIGSANAVGEEARIGLLKLHGSLGVIFYLILVVRVVSSLIQPRPVALEANRSLASVARGVHAALLGLIVVQLITGPLDVWSGGWPIAVFDLGAIPSPLGAGRQPWHELIGTVHAWSGLAIGGILLLHVGAALKHAIVDRDLVLPRMLGLARKSD